MIGPGWWEEWKFWSITFSKLYPTKICFTTSKDKNLSSSYVSWKFYGGNIILCNPMGKRKSKYDLYENESEAAQSCPTLCDPMDCSPSGSSIHEIFQARVLEWIAISFSRMIYMVCIKWDKLLRLSTYFLWPLTITLYLSFIKASKILGLGNKDINVCVCVCTHIFQSKCNSLCVT